MDRMIYAGTDAPRALPRAAFLRGLAVFAIVAQLALNASAWFLPLFSQFSAIGDYMSELVLGRHGWVQTVAFAIAGAGTLGLAWALSITTRGAPGSTAGSVLVALNGIGLLLAALFQTDRVDGALNWASFSPHMMVHTGGALVSLFGIAAAMWVFARTFRRPPPWHGLARWSAIFGVVTVVLLLAQQIEGPMIGLLQRMLVGTISLWQIMVALRIRAIASGRFAAQPQLTGATAP